MNTIKKIWGYFAKVVAIVWSWFMGSMAAKEFVVYELYKLAQKTDNTLDDAAVKQIAEMLGVAKPDEIAKD